MAPNRTNGTHANWTSILFCTLLVLYTTGFASASLLHWRQDDDTPSPTGEDTATAVESTIPDATDDITPTTTIIAPGTEPEETAAASDEPAATEEPTATDGDTVPEATITPTTNSTLPSNSTEEAQLTSAAAAAPTVTGTPLNDTNDPSECYVNRTDTPEFEGNPFCLPYAGQIIPADREIEVTWDTSLFPADTTTTVEVEYFDNPSDTTASTEPLEGFKALNSEGAMFMNMSSSWLKGQSTANLTLFFVSSDDESVLTGPTILLTKNNSTASSGSRKKLGEEVGIPVGLVIIGAALVIIGAFVCLRRRARGFTVTGKPRDQSMAAATGGIAATRGHRRDPSFHDEPTRGVELQDRNKAYAGDDNWDWGSPVSSPTRGGTGGNVFRDEVGRQKVGRGY